MTLTVAYITAREHAQSVWFIDSLARRIRNDDEIHVLIVDEHIERLHTLSHGSFKSLTCTPPKPTVWSGPHRLTKENWWSASNARNTAICLCRTDWIAFVDDRSVLFPGWLKSIREAVAGNYAVFGAYQKRTGLKVENGVITHAGIVSGEDSREQWINAHNIPVPYKCPGEWAFGCNLALPLEWALEVNGYEELCDGLSMEDVVFGKNLQNAGYDLRYDPRMKIIEDRTPEFLGKPRLRTSKERWPNDKEDKGHKALEKFCTQKRAQHQWNLCEIRESVLNGGAFPIPTGPTHDWFDGQPLAEMKP